MTTVKFNFDIGQKVKVENGEKRDIDGIVLMCGFAGSEFAYLIQTKYDDAWYSERFLRN